MKSEEEFLKQVHKVTQLESVIVDVSIIAENALIERGGNGHVPFSCYEYLMLSFLERYTANILAVKELLVPYRSSSNSLNANFILPIGIILRTGLSDFISHCYLLSGLREDKGQQKTYEVRVKELFSSHIFYQGKAIRDRKNEHIISENEYIEKLNLLYNKYSSYFESFDTKTGESKLRYKKNITIRHMYSKIKEEKYRYYAVSYDLYNDYSKMDHFGAFSHDFQKIDMALHVKKIAHSLLFVITGMKWTFGMINIKDRKSIGKKFDNNLNLLRPLAELSKSPIGESL